MKYYLFKNIYLKYLFNKINRFKKNEHRIGNEDSRRTRRRK